MKHYGIEVKVEKLTYILEIVITILIGIGVTIGLLDLIRYFPVILSAPPSESYDLFNEFLGYALVLIVGIELILMILNHSTKAILELVLFVIARKMLIYSHTMLDLVLGTLAIAMVFASLRYLIPKDDSQDIVKRDKSVYAASAKVSDILNNTGLDIPVDKANTLGGLVCSLAEEACMPVHEGSEFVSGDIKIKVVKASDEGLIKEVKILKKDED